MHETRPSPDLPLSYIAHDRQLDDLVRFCTLAERIMTVDSTFNLRLGDFDVMPTTYRYMVLMNNRSGMEPHSDGFITINDGFWQAPEIDFHYETKARKVNVENVMLYTGKSS